MHLNCFGLDKFVDQLLPVQNCLLNDKLLKMFEHGAIWCKLISQTLVLARLTVCI